MDDHMFCFWGQTLISQGKKCITISKAYVVKWTERALLAAGQINPTLASGLEIVHKWLYFGHRSLEALEFGSEM